MRPSLGWLALNTPLAVMVTVFVAGCSKPSEATGTSTPSTTVGAEIDDSVVTTSVKSALLADPDVRSFDFKVETRKGEVQLSGFVDNQSQMDHAIEVARAVVGLRSIRNEMNIKK